MLKGPSSLALQLLPFKGTNTAALLLLINHCLSLSLDTNPS